MGYIKVAYQEILNELDNNYNLPDDWNKFVDEQTVTQNLIIKSSKSKCYCTNCRNTFISKKKVNDTVKCPNCKNKYLIKRSNLRYYEFKDYLSILDRVNNIFVIRYFELKTIIDRTRIPSTSVVEFAREICNENYYRDIFVNERVAKCQCHIYIYHHNYCNDKKWREYTRNYSLIDYSIVFPNNIKDLLKCTELKYSNIWELAKHSKYINLLHLVQNKSEIPQVEILTKMKLYNLALQASKFHNTGSFYEIFGVSKDFYPFMKRHNITYIQLELLRLLEEKDINKIRYLEKFISPYTDSIYDIEEISKYISLNRFIKYAKIHHSNISTHLYKDYLRFAQKLGLDLKNNKYAFPKNLREEHDKLEKQYKIQCTELLKKAIIERGKILSKNIYKNDNYIIFPAKTLNDLKDESNQQNNCVRTYAEKYADGNSDIYFMRYISEPKKSLVTVEVKNNQVVQSKTKNNCEANYEQIQFLKKWEQNVLKQNILEGVA